MADHSGQQVPEITVEEHQHNLRAKRVIVIDEGGAVSGDGAVRKKLIDDTTTANVTYIGEAALGTATSASSWRIQKIDESSGVTITWSGTGFDAEWDERATSVVYT